MEMENRWSIWIDVEGFSSLYKRNSAKAIQYLGYLMEALFRIGAYVFRNDDKRLFIHQFGDGFIIVSDFPESSAKRPLAICMAVMRHLLRKGVVTKSAVSTGDFADILGCYPREVVDTSEDGRDVQIGSGIMTIMPVMGMALIAAHGLSTTDSGALLLIDTSKFSEIPEGIIVNPGNPSTVDWIHSNSEYTDSICQKASLHIVSPEIAEVCIEEYIKNNRSDLPEKWIRRTRETSSLDQFKPS